MLKSSQIQYGLARFPKQLLDLVLPNRCVACAEILAGTGALCTDCWNQIRFVTKPHCRACGAPFEVAALSGA